MTSPPDTTGLFPEVRVFPEHRYALAQPRSEVTVDTVINYGLAMAKSEHWRPGFTEVWDLRYSTVVDIRPRDISMILELEGWTKEELVGSETIIVANRPLLESIIQLYSIVVRPFGRVVRSVHSAEEAAEILGAPPIPILTDQ